MRSFRTIQRNLFNDSNYFFNDTENATTWRHKVETREHRPNFMALACFFGDEGARGCRRREGEKRRIELTAVQGATTDRSANASGTWNSRTVEDPRIRLVFFYQSEVAAAINGEKPQSPCDRRDTFMTPDWNSEKELMFTMGNFTLTVGYQPKSPETLSK